VLVPKGVEVTTLDVQRQPPAVKELAEALKPILRSGLPVSPDTDDTRLLGLRGVVARAVDRDDRLNRVKALDGLLHKLLVNYQDDVLSEAARVLFGLTPGTRGKNLTDRREQAARETGYDADHFRKRIEPKILDQIAWMLHQDAQNYMPREREMPGLGTAPPLEASGDTPTISVGDISSKEQSEHQEALSRLWAHVYNLRANILKVERLKVWPYDETEPDTSEQHFDKAVLQRNAEVRTVKILVEQYVQKYGETIEHGEGEFSARALLRLSGWTGE
jgi:hypothetical protein